MRTPVEFEALDTYKEAGRFNELTETGPNAAGALHLTRSSVFDFRCRFALKQPQLKGSRPVP